MLHVLRRCQSYPSPSASAIVKVPSFLESTPIPSPSPLPVWVIYALSFRLQKITARDREQRFLLEVRRLSAKARDFRRFHLSGLCFRLRPVPHAACDRGSPAELCAARPRGSKNLDADLRLMKKIACALFNERSSFKLQSA